MAKLNNIVARSWLLRPDASEPNLSRSRSFQHQRYDESGQHKNYESRDCESTLGLALNKTKEFENQAVTFGVHRFLG